MKFRSKFLFHKTRVILIVFVICVTFSFYYLLDINPLKVFIVPSENLLQLETKYILYWTPFWHQKDYYIGVGYEPFKNCQHKNCYATYNRSALPIEEFDVLIFHGIHNKNQIDLPGKRSAKQMYVFMIIEAPAYICPNLKPYGSFFNWTMTYRFDSDLIRRHDDIRRKSTYNQTTYSFDLKGKTKLAAWFASNCHTSSKREKLVKEIQKHMPVDVYGSCGNLTCRHSKISPKLSSEDCYDMVEKRYKFYFSFENSYCQDYSTEKLYKILRRNIVPVVYGAGDYNISAPPKSVINVNDFQSAEKLVKYLKYLDSNDDEYLKYFQWKLNYSVENNSVACSLCQKLNEPKKKSVYHDLYTWWWGVNKSKCKLNKNLPNIVSSLL